MAEIKAKLKVARGAYNIKMSGRVSAAFAERSRPGARLRLDSGEELILALRPGEVLRGGELATTSDGRVIEVLASAEKLLQAEGADTARAAFRLGGAHVPVEFASGVLRFPENAGTEELLHGLAVRISAVQAPFEPEVADHRHDHAHGHDHGHDHDHDHDHHGHGHHHHNHRK